jgi:hypothetical protein
MPRVTIHLPNDLHNTLNAMAEKNDDSLSSTIAKMAEIGILVTENQKKNKSPEDRFSDIEKHCFKLLIQVGALVKNLSIKELGYGNDEFRKLNDACFSKYRELLGLGSEEI